MDQLTLYDMLDSTDRETSKRNDVQTAKIYSPSELYQKGIKWTMEDEKRWKEAVFALQRRERSKGNWINWFQACDLYIQERDYGLST